MKRRELVLDPVHQATLREISAGMTVFHSSYPPVLDLVEAGYCAWVSGNPDTWEVELTPRGFAAAALANRPDIDDGLWLEKVDEIMYRIVDQNGLVGSAVRYPDGTWRGYDRNANKFADEPFSSPASVLLMFKMTFAKMEADMFDVEEALYEELMPPSFM